MGDKIDLRKKQRTFLDSQTLQKSEKVAEFSPGNGSRRESICPEIM